MIRKLAVVMVDIICWTICSVIDRCYGTQFRDPEESE